MTSLILLTVSYPYGLGEQFIESEIEYLAKEFDEILILPARCNSISRVVPNNVKVDTAFANTHKLLDIFFAALKSKHTYLEIIKHPNILFSMKKIQRLLSFMGRGNAQYHYLNMYTFNSRTVFYSYWFNGSTYALFLLRQNKDIKYIFRAHRGDLYLNINHGYLPFRKQIIDRANAVFPISSDGVTYMKKTYAKDVNTPIEVCRLGVKNPFNTTYISSSNTNELHILSCAHMSEVKQIHILIKALEKLGNNNPKKKIYWTHIGNGPLFENVKAMCKKLPENISTELLGHMDNQDILNYYSNNNFDLFINTSKSEGIPVTFMEAMSFGIPVMAPDVGGIPEIISKENGFLLSSNINDEEVYLALNKILHKKSILVKKSLKARETWENKYNAEKNYKRFSRRLLNICEGKS